MNKAGAGGDGPILTRLTRIATEIGPYKLMTVGLGARSVVEEVAVRRDMKIVKRRIVIRLLSAISRVRSEEPMEYNLSRASIDSSD